VSAEPVRHAVDPAVAEEFPGLRLWSLALSARPGASNAGLKTQLRMLSNRMSGAQAIALRREPIPHAYRVFFRHVGIDPERRRTPIEQAVLERLQHGSFRSRNLVDDALLIALVETGVPVWALDEDALKGELRLRVARAEDAGVPAGRLAVADDARALLELFGPMIPGVGVTPASRRLRLFAVAVGGVPEIHVEEALFTAGTTLSAG
jgi:DNA/RNA-binding domain of Phe-tRNA-synthetase-like protein